MSAPILLAGILGLALSCAPVAVHAASALADLIASIESVARLDTQRVAAAYRETVLRREGVGRTIARLLAYAEGVRLSPLERSKCYLAIAHLHWRDGDTEKALAFADRALESESTSGSMLLKARLLDARGDTKEARDWYLRAESASASVEEQWLIRIRLAMMKGTGQNVQALEDLAAGRDQMFRNQAAVALALLGRPERAIAIYRPLEEAGPLFRQHVRLAEWAIKAGEHERAREQAWLAYAQASLRAEGLYALALLAESYREAGELNLLIDDLDSRSAGDKELLSLRMDALVETEQYGQAISLYRQLDGAELDVEARRRLISLYEAVGDTDAMVSEYRRLMEAEPGQVQWYEGLASHYLNMADDENALEVWYMLEERNFHRPEVLVQAARLMLQMGFGNDGVDMIERYLQVSGPDVSALNFLFEAWLEKGRQEHAFRTLRRLEHSLPPAAAELRDLANAYERLDLHGEAVRIYEEIKESRGALGYDEKIRLAGLYTTVDRRHDALQQWRQIWVEAESPARRRFVESRLLGLAAQLGALGDIATELEGMLANGTASRGDMNLLVRIYTETGDKLSATETIDEYAAGMGDTEISRQEQLAQVYKLVEDYPAHDRALRRLYEIDPANRVEHAKNIILNLLTFDLAEGSDQRFEEISTWVGELRRIDPQGVSGEFEASVYSLGGFDEEAIQSYRRALVERPENSDNLLLMADLMKNAGRGGEAVAILQYFAENAVDENDFVVAVDGLINMIGPRSFSGQPPPDAANTLDWTRRVILERIAARANKFYLYELLADIAREMGDTEGSFLAVESSLAEAGLRRPAILRELLTMATPNAGFGGFNTGSGDLERQLKHGRRLVALRQQLPPEVYIDIGAAILRRGDVQGAERALEMMDDVTGLIDVDLAKAELFEQEGYFEEALVYYNRAFNGNRDSLELLHKTASMHESIGSEEVAFRRYFAALKGSLARQSMWTRDWPAGNSGFSAGYQYSSEVTREFRDYYDSLEQGLLLTWPADAVASSQAIRDLKELLEQELSGILNRTRSKLSPLAHYPRVERTAGLLRRIGFYRSDSEIAQHADMRLLEHFGDDEAYAGFIREQYAAAGQQLPALLSGNSVGVSPSEDEAVASAPLRRQLERARSRGDFETRLQLLRLAGASAEIRALLKERILAGKFRDGLGYALALLSETEFKRLALEVAHKLRDERRSLLSLLASHAEIFLEAERVAAHSLVPQQEVLDLLLDKGDAESPNGQTLATSGASGFWDYLEARGSVDDRIRYLQVVAERAGPERIFASGRIDRPLRSLLKLKLSERQRRDIASAVTGALSQLDAKNESLSVNLMRSIMITDARRENAGVLYRIADYAHQRWPSSVNLRPLLEALYQDQPEAALEQVIELTENMPQFDYYLTSWPGLAEAVAAMRLRLLDQVSAGRRIAPKVARKAYEMDRVFRFGRSAHRKVELLESLQDLYPEDDRYRYELIDVWLLSGRLTRAVQLLTREYRAAPDDQFWRNALFFLMMSQERFEEALAVATDGGPDLRDTRVRDKALRDIVGRGLRSLGTRIAVIFGYRVFSPASAPSRLGSAPGAPRDARQYALQHLREALTSGNHEQGRLALRGVWRNLLAGERARNAHLPPGARLQMAAKSLLATPLKEFKPPSGVPASMNLGLTSAGDTPPRPVMLFDAIADAPYGAAEMESYLRAMPPNSRREFHQLYEYLGRALNASDGSGELGARLRAKTMDDHEFMLWMLLRDRAGVALSDEDLAAFEERLAATSDPAPYQLLLAARVFAAAGAVEQAVEHYKLVAARRIQHNEYASQQYSSYSYRSGSSDYIDLSTLVDEAAAKLPAGAAREVLDAVLLLAVRGDDIPAADAMFDAFAVSSLAKLYAPEEVLAQVRQRLPGALDLPERLVGAWAAKAVEQVRAFARAGDFERVTEILRAMLAEPAPDAGPSLAKTPQEARSDHAVRTLGELYGIYITGQPSSVPATMGLRRGQVFTAGTGDLTDAMEWPETMVEVLLGLLESREVDPDSAVQLLMTEASRLDTAGNPVRSRDLLERTMAAAAGLTLDAFSVATMVFLAQRVAGSAPVEFVAGALEQGVFSGKQFHVLLGSYADSVHAGKLLEAARQSGLDQGLAVITQLRALAEQSGDAAYAEELQRRMEREESARDALLQDRAEAPSTTAMIVP